MPETSNYKTKRRVIISGSTSGLGKEIALGLAKRGWTVAGFGQTKNKVKALAAELGEKHHIFQANVSCDDSIASAAKQIIEKFGPPHLLINNAAIMNSPAPLWEVSAKEFDEMSAVNINGVANMIRHFVPSMIRNGNGIIVNLSSGWGRSTSPNVAPYCATKWAIEGMSSALAQELPNGMACIALNPGIINTEMLRKCWAEGASAYQNPKEWAKMAIPLIERINAGDNGRQMTVT
ncbi:MAG: SDR family oxidoreductase [Verrucomicrobiota bacterium]|nr:SDR family oxidoreductase [Verrucomicrobiota bacterium]MEC9326276.1 SDR family oxidoreductase [Verrucomicrobiota bacterium]